MTLPHLVILGGGISGLSVAWYLQQFHSANFKITIVEKQSRVGGWISTIQEEGFLFEKGPRGCRPQQAGLEVLSLVYQLGLEDQLITANPYARQRFLWKDRRLQKIPSSPIDLFSSLGRTMCRAVCTDLFTPKDDEEKEESIREFFIRRFGAPFTDTFVEALVLGIYAGDDSHLSLKSCFSALHEAEKKDGSVVKSFLKKKFKKKEAKGFSDELLSSPLFSFIEGMQTLPKAIARKLSCQTVISSGATALKINGDKTLIHLENEVLEADYLVLAIPIGEIARLLAPHAQGLSSRLAEIPKSTVDVISVGYREDVLRDKGFGYLVPSSEKEDILGVVWDSSIFPQQNNHCRETRLSCMIGGIKRQELTAKPLEHSTEIALRAMKEHLKIDIDPTAIHSYRAFQAIPQYNLGHAAQVLALENWAASISSRLFFTGNSLYGVSVNDCVSRGKKIAQQIYSS